MSAVDDLFEKLRRTAQMPDPSQPTDIGPFNFGMRKKKATPSPPDVRKMRMVDYQENVRLTLESIRRGIKMECKLLSEMLDFMKKNRVMGELFETIILLPPNKAVLQIDFLGGDHTNFDPTTNLASGDVAIPFGPAKILTIINKGDNTINYYSNPRYQNLQRVSNTVDPGDTATVESNPPNIARVNLLNKNASGTGIVKIIA